MSLITFKFDEEKLNRGFIDIKKANSIATKNTLNVIAFVSRKNYIQKANDNLILRNNYTVRNIRVDKAEGDDISLMESHVGASDKIPYMELQENSGLRKPKRGNTLAIGQNESRAGNKRNLISKNMYLKSIKKRTIKFSKRKGSRKAALIATVMRAKTMGMFLHYNKNIYEIKNVVKSKSGVHFTTRHIYNLSKTFTRVKSNPMLAPAIQKPCRDFQQIYNSQIDKLLRMREII